jgi:hypothetical protein
MKYNFLDTVLKITKELNGRVCKPIKDQSNDLEVSFMDENCIIYDHLKLKVSMDDYECGVIIKSSITNGEYVSLKTYTFLLVDRLEYEFGKTISLKPCTSRFYFLGELDQKNIKIFY